MLAIVGWGMSLANTHHSAEQLLVADNSSDCPKSLI